MLPDLVMVRYHVPDALGMETINVAQLPFGWQRQESLTQARGDARHQALTAPLLRVPSAIVPLEAATDDCAIGTPAMEEKPVSIDDGHVCRAYPVRADPR